MRIFFGLTHILSHHTVSPPVSQVWFDGGRQWRFVDAYSGTRVMDEVRNVLVRGGVVGGSSAGATVLGEFLTRGDTKSNQLIVGDHTVSWQQKGVFITFSTLPLCLLPLFVHAQTFRQHELSPCTHRRASG
eukprot:SAG11_NODE_1516_length_4766_cov_1.916006_2_plen_131_part_00